MNYNLKHFAYIGDAVYELFIREIVINKTQKQDMMHRITTNYVNAKAQADILNKIIGEFDENELELQRRGRNLKITINKRNNPQIHSLATSFEVVIGYLYLTDKDRLKYILNKIKEYLEENL